MFESLIARERESRVEGRKSKMCKQNKNKSDKSRIKSNSHFGVILLLYCSRAGSHMPGHSSRNATTAPPTPTHLSPFSTVALPLLCNNKLPHLQHERKERATTRIYCHFELLSRVGSRVCVSIRRSSSLHFCTCPISTDCDVVDFP